MFSDCHISIDVSHSVMSLITLPVISFETCWQFPASETANCAVKRLDYAYLGVFLEANTGCWSP